MRAHFSSHARAHETWLKREVLKLRALQLLTVAGLGQGGLRRRDRHQGVELKEPRRQQTRPGRPGRLAVEPEFKLLVFNV